MNFVKIFQDLTKYNTRANIQIAEWLQHAEPELLTQKIPSSFSTLKSTMLHIWDAERFWLSFLEKRELEKFRKEFEGNEIAFFYGFQKQSEDLETFVCSLNKTDLEELYTIDKPWLKGTLPCSVFIQHVVNHSTYHRGQLITMGRMLGLENPPNTDFAKFVIKR